SSFGFSGTNAHVVVEESPITDAGHERVENDRPLHILTLSAKTPTSLRKLAENYSVALSARCRERLSDLAYTANSGRAHFSHRLAIIAADTADAQRQLTAIAADSLRRIGESQAPSKPKIAFLFTGQGSQYPGMGRRLYDTQPTFRRTLERCDEILRGVLERP